MTAVQTSYSERHRIATAGLLDGVGDVTTRLVETAAGIGFGLAVSKGSGDNGAVLGGTKFLGFSVKDPSLVPTTDANVDLYRQYSEVGIRVTGNIWVKVGDAVNAWDDVYYSKTTGVAYASKGTVTVGTPDATGNAAGTGAMTLADPAHSSAVQEGTYNVRLRDPETATGVFDVIRPDGTIDGVANVGVAYDGQIKFTIADGTPDFTAGEGFTVAVSYTNAKAVGAKFRDTAAQDGYARVSLVRPG